MKFRLASVWPGGSGPGIWFLAGLLMLEEVRCCLAPPLHPFPAWDLSLQPFLPAGLGAAGASPVEGWGSPEGMQPMGFNTLRAQVSLHTNEAGK